MFVDSVYISATEMKHTHTCKSGQQSGLAMGWGVWFGVSQANGENSGREDLLWSQRGQCKIDPGSGEVKHVEQVAEQKWVLTVAKLCVQNEQVVMTASITNSCILKGKQRKSGYLIYFNVWLTRAVRAI